MSKLGKIFLWIAFAGLLTSGGAGYFLIQKKNDLTANLASETTAKTQALSEAAKQKKAAEAEALARAATEKQLADTNIKVTDLTTQLTAATSKADEAQKALDGAKAEGAKAVADLAAINEKLQGKSIEEIFAARDKALTDMASAQAEQKIIADQLQEATSRVEQLKKDINSKAIGFIPPGVSGKVTFVNHTWNFVVIDVGLNNSVVPNGTLIVYRKNTFLGKIKVTTADANSAVADILPDAKGDIQVGDYVLN